MDDDETTHGHEPRWLIRRTPTLVEGEWMYHAVLVAPNNEIVCVTETVPRHAHACTSISAVARYAAHATIKDDWDEEQE